MGWFGRESNKTDFHYPTEVLETSSNRESRVWKEEVWQTDDIRRYDYTTHGETSWPIEFKIIERRSLYLYINS